MKFMSESFYSFRRHNTVRQRIPHISNNIACLVMNSLQWVWNCSSLVQYQHQCPPVPSTDKVCSVLRYRNVDTLDRRHEYTGGFRHEVSAKDTWCICRGASAIWFAIHWWHLTSSRLISAWPCCMHGPWSTSTWYSASYGGYLWRQKANGQLEKTAGSPSQRLAQQDSGGC